jgi:hypothetical protein
VRRLERDGGDDVTTFATARQLQIGPLDEVERRRRGYPEKVDYDATRPDYDDASPWDKTVRYVRARDRLRARGGDPAALLEVARVDGVTVLREQERPEMSEPL